MISDCRSQTNFRPSAVPAANCASSPNPGIRLELSSRLRSQGCPECSTNLKPGMRRRSVRWTVQCSVRERFASSFRSPEKTLAKEPVVKTISTAPSSFILPNPRNEGGGNRFFVEKDKDQRSATAFDALALGGGVAKKKAGS